MDKNSLLEAALAYASEGLYVFPMRPGTKGFFSKVKLSVGGKGEAGGFKVASRDPNTIRTWWTRWPHANVGISTGPSALVVVDIDIKDGAQGEVSWATLVKQHGEAIGETRTSMTASGGRQKWYIWRMRNIRNSASALASGIDIRAVGGLVIAPPSRITVGPHPGSYSWEPDTTMAVAPLPEALARLLVKPAPSATTKIAPPIASVVPRGERDNTLISAAGSMRRRGLSGNAILAALLVTNREKCRPPLPEADVRRIAASAARYDPAAKYHLTPFGNSNRFVADNAGGVLHDHTRRRWLYWNKSYWKPDMDGEVRRRGRRTLIKIHDEVSSGADDADRKRIASWAARSETERTLKEMLSLARDSVSIKATFEELDMDGWLLNTPQGTINLRTGKRQDPNPKDRLTKTTGCGPVGESTGAWDRHIRYFLPEGNTRRHVQRELGRAMVGEFTVKALNIWHGEGYNGRTTTFQVLRWVLKDYCQVAPRNLLVAGRWERHPTELAALWGSRMVFSEEVKEGAQLAEAAIKQMTGGGDITAHFMRQDDFTFKQTWEFTLAVNHKPEIRGRDLAIWERVRLVPWTVVIPKHERRDMNEVVSELREDGHAVLRWLLKGLRDWQDEPHWLPDSVVAATEEYRTSQNNVVTFIEERCDKGPDYAETKAAFYDAYADWCWQGRETKVPKRRIGGYMPPGISDGRGSGGIRIWDGLQLKGLGIVTTPVEGGYDG